MAVIEEKSEGLEFARTQDIKSSAKIDILAYGDSGSGKTTFASTFNVLGPVFFIDLDKGMLSIRGKADIEYITIVETLPKPTAYNTLLKILKRLDDLEDTYDTVVIDSLTTLTDIAMNAVMFENGKLGANPTFPEWGEQMRRIKSTIDRLLAKKWNLILTAHEEIEKDEVSGRVWCLPMVTGKLSKRLPLYFDEVYHLQVESAKDKESSYTMLTRPDRWYTAKSRLGYKDAYVPTHFNSVKEALGR